MKFGNEVYSVTFKTPDKDNLPLYGCMYDFHLEGVVDCPEFLVYFPLLEKLVLNKNELHLLKISLLLQQIISVFHLRKVKNVQNLQ